MSYWIIEIRLQITFRGIHLSNSTVNFSIQQIRFARVGGSTVNRPYVVACGGGTHKRRASLRARDSVSRRAAKLKDLLPPLQRLSSLLQTVPSTSDLVVTEDAAR